MTARSMILWISTLMLIGIMATIAMAEDTTAPLSLEDLARMRYVKSVELSPDGNMAAHLLAVPRDPFGEEDGGAWSELHVYDLKAKRSLPFITGEVGVSGVSFSPCGKQILYLAKRGKDKQRSLYRIPVAGGESVKVYEHETAISSYSLSPDGQQIAFLAKPAKSEERKDLEEKGFKQKVYEESAQPTRVHVADLKLCIDAPVTNVRVLPLEGSASLLRWSTVDDRLALALAPTPSIDDNYLYRKIFVIDPADGATLATIGTEGKLGDIRWSPDGKQLAILGATDLRDPATGRLLVAPSNGGPAVDILPDLLAQVRDLQWKNDSTITFLLHRGLYSEMGTVRSDGSKIDLHGDPEGPVLNSFSGAPDSDRLVAVGSSPAHPGELFSIQKGKTTKLSCNNPWLADRRLAKQEAVSYPARDGLQLDGILIHPLDAKEGVRVPLVLMVHGGPEAHRSMGWQSAYSRPAQVLAAEGMAVFIPNYRGSTGRGVAFSKMGQADPAGKEFDDVVDAIDYLDAERGLIDPAKVGITGGSYGGYATAWGATYYTDRFAAGVMFAGISDNNSKFGTTDIPDEMLYSHQQKRVYDDFQFSLERSPIYHTAEAKTPLLILHGENDARVDKSQAVTMYRYLKVRRPETPVRLVLYPGEGHGNRKAAARLDTSLRLVRWMKHYLQGPGGEMPSYDLNYEN